MFSKFEMQADFSDRSSWMKLKIKILVFKNTWAWWLTYGIEIVIKITILNYLSINSLLVAILLISLTFYSPLIKF